MHSCTAPDAGYLFIIMSRIITNSNSRYFAVLMITASICITSDEAKKENKKTKTAIGTR